jgi:hypothetical protein
MTSHDLFHGGGLGEMTLRESEDKWQKHVILALWVAIGLLVVSAVALWCANANGLLESLAVHAIPGWPIPSWPVDLP